MSVFCTFNRAMVSLFAFFFVVLFSCSIISSELVPFTKCLPAHNNLCEISNVAVTPCPEAADNATCIAYRGTNTTIAFDFVPTVSAPVFSTQTYSSGFLVDIPDFDHDKNGCKYTKCPIKAGEKQHFSYTRFVKEIYPPGTYLVKWKLWVDTKEECCFLVFIRLV